MYYYVILHFWYIACTLPPNFTNALGKKVFFGKLEGIKGYNTVFLI